MMLIVVSVLGVVSLLYLCMSRLYSYWSRLGVVQPSPLPLSGNILPALLNRTSIGLVFDEIYRRYPKHDAVGVYSFLTPKLLVRSPRLIQRVLISDFSSFHDNEFTVNDKLEPVFVKDPFCAKGAAWKQSRAQLTSALTSRKIKEIFPLMRDLVPRVDKYIDQRLTQDIDAKELAALYTMDTVSDSVFGISSNCFADPQAVFRRMSDVQKVDVMQCWWKTLLLTTMPTARDLMGIQFVPTPVTEFIRSIVQEVSDCRTIEKITRNDLFNHFMKKAADKEDPVEDIVTVCLSFFVESFETSALTTSRALYELAMNPRVQQTLHDELTAALGDKGQLDYETLVSLPYLDQVICESQRKYPVLMTFTRVCTQPAQLEVDGNTLLIQPGTTMIVPVFSVHHDPLYYPDPEKFDPDRFSKSNVEARPSCTFMPFGEGPRICPGLRFGLTQVKLLLSNIVLKYEILKSDRTPERLTFTKTTFLTVPNEKLWIRMRKRN